MVDLSIDLSIYQSTYLPIHLTSFCHSSVLAFLLLHPPSSIQNAFSTFFLVSLKSMLSVCFLLKSLLSLYIPVEIFTFSSLVYWNPYFPFTFLVKSLLSVYFMCWVSYFTPLFRWKPDFFFTFPLKSLPFLHFSIEILTFSALFCWNLSFPSTFLMKSPLSLHFSAEISRKHVGDQIKKIPN